MDLNPLRLNSLWSFNRSFRETSALGRTAVVLAGHGAGEGSSANQWLEGVARDLGRVGFAEVSAAFHRGRPRFSEVLSRLHSRRTVVVPVLTSAGHYCDVVLPRELRRDPRFGETRLEIGEPLGARREVWRLIAARAQGLADRRDVAFAVVGHGTRRHPRTRETARDLAAYLSSEVGPSAAFFLDDDPPLEEIAGFRGGCDLVVLPFLLGGGRHQRKDLEARLRAARLGREWLVDRALYEYPELPGVIEGVAVELALRGSGVSRSV